MHIRSAFPEEASILSELAFRSKSYWPYSKDQLENYKSELEVFKEDILCGSVFVLEADQKIIGFYGLSSDEQKQRLYFLFVDPGFIGQGYGKALWSHAVSIAKERGWQSLSFYADSYAVEAFYRYQHCKVIGSLESKLGTLTEMSFVF